MVWYRGGPHRVDGGGPAAYVVPIAAMVVLIGAVGFLAVRVVPRVLEDAVLPRVPQRHRPRAVLGSLFLVAMLLIPACKYTGSSELLGAWGPGSRPPASAITSGRSMLYLPLASPRRAVPPPIRGSRALAGSS